MKDETENFWDDTPTKKVRKLKRAKHYKIPKQELETVIEEVLEPIRPKRKLKRRSVQEDSLKTDTTEDDKKAKSARQQARIADITARIQRLKPAFHSWGHAKWKAYYDSHQQTPFWILDNGTIGVLLMAREYLELFGDLKPPKSEADSIRLLQKTTLKSWGDKPVTGSMILDSAEGPVRIEFEGQIPDFLDKPPTELAQEDELEDDGFGFVDSRPKAEIIEGLKIADTESVGGVVPTPEVVQQQMSDMEKIREAGLQQNPMEQKWAIAETLARKSDATQITDAMGDDYELQTMVVYCRKWISTAGEVPNHPTNLIEIYHPKKELPMGPIIEQRREFIIAKVKAFLAKSREAGGEEYNPKTTSYRRVVWKYRMEDAIEDYALAQDPTPEVEENLKKRVADSASEFFLSHFPLDLEGVKPGPIETLDPDYITYRGLIRKYKIKYGLMLHKVDL